MRFNSTIIKFSLSLLLTIFFIAGTISCNDRHTGNNSTLTDTLDNSQIKKLPDNYYQGENIFKKYCNGCHVEPERRMTDQYIFDNLFDRLPSPPEDYFIKYIQDSKSLKASGDIYAQKVGDAWNSKYEHYFKDSLSQQDFNNLIIYIKVAVKQKYQKSTVDFHSLNFIEKKYQGQIIK